MKKLLLQNKSLLFSIGIFLAIWRIFLVIPDLLGRYIPRHPGYIGPVGWANLDGIHYLEIGKGGYMYGQQAFFPVFPFTIGFLGNIFSLFPYHAVALVFIYICFICSLFFFAKLIELDFSKKTVYWSLMLFIFFPSGFFLGSVYTESLFLALTFISLYLARKGHFVWASIAAGIASGTRIVGIFLLPAILIELYQHNKKNLKISLQNILYCVLLSLISAGGLLGYIFYLWRAYGDPLMFVHVQSLFGANRTNGKIILLPQIFVRYVKILLTIPYTNHDFWIALLEIISFIFFAGVLIFFWKKIRPSYLIFSLASILLPTATGTFSSMPRYVLVAFPVFIILGNIKNMALKVLLLILFMSILIATTAFFLRGYFIA